MKKLLIVMLLLLACTACDGDAADAVADVATDVKDAGVAFDKKDYAKAIQKYKAAGIKGDAFAQSMIGVMYNEEIGRAHV